MFEAMMDRVEDETLRYLFLMRTPEEEEEMIRQYQQRKRREQSEMQMSTAGMLEKPQQVIRKEKIGATIPARVEAARSIRNATGRELRHRPRRHPPAVSLRLPRRELRRGISREGAGGLGTAPHPPKVFKYG